MRAVVYSVCHRSPDATRLMANLYLPPLYFHIAHIQINGAVHPGLPQNSYLCMIQIHNRR